MTPPLDSVAILFPGALGDFLCLLPTLRGLRDRHGGTLLLVATPTLLDLIEMPALTTASIDRREIADLFVVGSEVAPTTRSLLGGFDRVYSWTGFGNAEFLRRLSVASGGRVEVYRFRGMHPGEHAVDYYARCAGVATMAARVEDIRRDEEWFAAFKRRHQLTQQHLFVLHPGSGSPRKNWRGFDEVIRSWRRHHPDAIVLVRGPAEIRGATPHEAGLIAVEDLTLPQVAALLHNCTLYLGNDSGISHLAGAVGATGVVLFGPSDPVAWAPRGDRLHVVRAHAPCTQCASETFCVHRLPVASVVRALAARLEAPGPSDLTVASRSSR